MICDDVLKSGRTEYLAVGSNEVSFDTCGSHIPSLFSALVHLPI